MSLLKKATPRSVVVEEFEIARQSETKCTMIRVKVRFQDGGLCYATYKQAPKGYALSVEKFDREVGKYGTSEAFILFGSSVGVFLENATRFNGKRLAELAASAKQRPDYAELIERAKNLGKS